MTIQEALKKQNSDPEFVAKTYDEQLHWRSALLNAKLIKEPAFIAFTDSQKTMAYEKLLYQAPAFEENNPKIAAEMDSYIKAIETNIDPDISANQIMQGTPEELKQKSTIKYLYALNFVRKWTEDSVLAEGIWKGISKIIDVVQPGRGKKFYQSVKKGHRDMDKLLSYMDYKMSADKRTAGMLGPMTFIAKMGAMAADLSVMYNLTTASAIGFASGATSGMGLFKTLSMAKGFKTLAKFSKPLSAGLQKATLHAAAPIAHATMDGFIGVLRENMHDNLIKGMTNLTSQEIMRNSVKYFGEYALGDILMFTGFKLAGKFFGTAGRYISGKVKGKTNPLEEVNDAIKRIVQLEDLDPVWFARQSPIDQEVLRQTQAAMKTFSKVERLTPENAFKVFSGSRGFLALPDGPDGWKMLSLFDDDLRKTFKPTTTKAGKTISAMDKAVTWVNDTIEKISLKTTGKTPNIVSSEVAASTIKSKLKVQFPKASENALKLLTETIAPVAGKFTSEGIETFAKGFLKVGNATDDAIRGLKAVQEGSEILLKSGDGVLARVPKYVGTAADETSAIKSITDSLDKLIEGKQSLQDVYLGQLKTKALYTPSWVDNFAKQRGSIIKTLDNGTIETNLFGKLEEFADYNDLGNKIVQDFVKQDPALLKQYLSNYHGVNLVASKGKYTLYRSGKKISESYDDLSQVIAKNPEFTPAIPAELGPKMTLVNNATQVEYHQGVLTGQTSDILTELSKFKDIQRGKKPIHFRGANVLPLGTEFELNIPKLGFTETFDSVDKINKFINKELFEKIEYIAPRKGFIFSRFSNQFHLTTENGKTFVANSLDEAAEILSTKGIMPEWAPELTGVDSQLLASLKKIPGFHYKPEDFMPVPGTKDLSAGQVFSTLYRAPDQFFRKAMIKGVKGSEDVLSRFRALEDARELGIGMSQKMAPVIDDTFKFRNGRNLNKVERSHITALSEMQPELWDDYLKTNKLKPELKSVANNLREFYGKNADSGLYGYMGNDPQLFLKEYMPVLRKYVATGQMKRFNDVDVNAFLSDAYKTKVPKQISVFFEHARTSDIIDLARETDAKLLLQKYVVLGNRKKYLSPVIEEINNWAMSNGGNIDDGLLKRFGAYLTDVAGVPSTLNEKLAQDFTEKLFTQLKIGDKIAAKNITEVFMGASYIATMGWRAWLPVRNSFQIWTTLAPRMGNTWTAKGIEALYKDKTGAIYKMLQQRGIITAGLPVGGSEMFKGSDLIAKFTKSSLAAYKNSDSFTRAVAYMTTKVRFDDAFERFSKGLLDQKQFIKHSGLYNLAEDRLSAALKLLSEGKVDSAMDLFGRDMVIETMFPYRAGTSPLAYRGVIGKLFGQMGHYPQYWIENIKRGVTRGGGLDKLGYITRFLGNTTAIATSLTAIGVKSSTFLAWSPAQFSGGPWYDILNDGIQLWGKGYEGKQARAKLLGIKSKDGKPYWDLNALRKSPISTMLGVNSVMFQSLEKAGKYLNNGDFYRFIMSLASVPMV